MSNTFLQGGAKKILGYGTGEVLHFCQQQILNLQCVKQKTFFIHPVFFTHRNILIFVSFIAF